MSADPMKHNVFNESDEKMNDLHLWMEKEGVFFSLLGNQTQRLHIETLTLNISNGV